MHRATPAFQRFAWVLVFLATTMSGCQKDAAQQQAAEEAAPDGATTPKSEGDEARPTTSASGSATTSAAVVVAVDSTRFPKLANYLPADTVIFAVAEVGDIFEKGLLGEEWTEAFYGKERYAEMRKDMSELFVARVGFDPLAVKWVAMGISEQEWGVVFLGGMGPLAADLERAKVDGLDLVRWKSGDGSFVEFADLDAVAFVPEEDDLAKFAALTRGEQPKLAGSERFGALQATMETLDGGMLQAVARLDAAPFAKLLKDAPPGLDGLRSVGLTAGGKVALKAVVKGSPESIKVLEGLFGMAMGMLEKEIVGQKAKLDRLSTPEGVGVIIASHAFAGAKEKLTPQFAGEQATMEVPLPSGPASALVALVGVGAAVAVPGFVKYIDRSKESEAEWQLRSLADGAMAYYFEEHASPDGQVVSQRFPDLGGKVCTAPFKADGAKIDPSETPQDVQDRFTSELRFAIYGPHYFQYCYEAVAGGEGFVATAEAAFRAGKPSKFVVRGTAENGVPSISEITKEL